MFSQTCIPATYGEITDHFLTKYSAKETDTHKVLYGFQEMFIFTGI